MRSLLTMPFLVNTVLWGRKSTTSLSRWWILGTYRAGAGRSQHRAAVHDQHDTLVLPCFHIHSPSSRIWSFQKFNAIQSALHRTVAKSDRNVVVSAPTGCGKVKRYATLIE